VSAVKEAGANRIFLDLKFHDIPTTVFKAMQAAMKLGVDMVNVHVLSGEEALRMAASCHKNLKGSDYPLIIGVSVLSSLETDDLEVLGFGIQREKLVLRLAEIAYKAGLHGVVASGQEIATLRRELPKGFIIVCPGVFVGDRSSLPKDQKEGLHAKEAVSFGADFIVLGRSLKQCPNPQEVLANIAR
jgi:orotidine-5'-phosphate decarboxylase